MHSFHLDQKRADVTVAAARRDERPRLRFLLCLLSLLVAVAAHGANVSAQEVSAESLPTAVGQLTASDLALSCGPVSATQGMSCQFQFVAPVGTRFGTDTAAWVWLTNPTSTSNAISCQLMGSLGSEVFTCQAQLPLTLPIPSSAIPASYQLVVSGAGQSQSFCGVLATHYPTSTCPPA